MRNRAIYLVALLLGACGTAWGDGGTVQVSVAEEGYRVTIMTSPSPLRAGPVDVSVLVQDEGSGATVVDARCEIELRQPERSIRAVASREAATNKLFQSAQLELPAAGGWTLEARVIVGNKRIVASTEITAAGPLPAVNELWVWIGWPAVAVGLFVMHRALVEQRVGKLTSRNRPGRSTAVRRAHAPS